MSSRLDRIRPLVGVRPNDKRGIWQVKPVETTPNGDYALGMVELVGLAPNPAGLPDMRLIPSDERQEVIERPLQHGRIQPAQSDFGIVQVFCNIVEHRYLVRCAI
jgi:hypothetical protein